MKEMKRSNNDSKGLSTGIELGQIFADYELSLIKNRKYLLEQSLKGIDFKSRAYELIYRFDEACDKDTQVAVKRITERIKKEFDATEKIATSEVETRIAQLIRQGFVPTAESEKGKKTSITALSLSQTLLTLGGLILSAKHKALEQSLSVITQASSDVTVEDIDSLQSSFLKKGIAASTKQGDRELTAYSEFIARNDIQRFYLHAKGEKRAEYGIQYVLISAHPSSCPLCIPWQNKVLIDDYYAGSRGDGKTALYSTAIDEGLHHFNCRHTSVEFVPGVDRPDLFKKDTASVKETAQRYAVEQTQRRNERAIREWKREAEGAITPQRRAFAESKVKEWEQRQTILKKATEKAGLPFYRQREREEISGKTYPQSTLELLLRQRN